MTRSGPLKGIRVLEFVGLGPLPYCGMLLSDLGADVLRIDRKGSKAVPHDVHGRGKRSLALDLKDPADVALALEIIARADVVMEGLRPGVMEKLGLGPDVASARNPRLVYGRMTGWGQTGPLARAAGHDINFIALAGALASFGPPSAPPVPPLNLVGDFGGGALFLTLGILAALLERERSGRGQVIDAAMVDGVASLMSLFSTLKANRATSVRRGDNFLDGSAHYYGTYECADHRYIAIGSGEPQFYKVLWDKLATVASLPQTIPGQEKENWAPGRKLLASIFATKTRDEWCALLEATDVCFAPVLEFDEAPRHPHMRARSTFVDAFDVVQAAPAPRLSRTPGAVQGPPPAVGAGGHEALEEWGVRTGREG